MNRNCTTFTSWGSHSSYKSPVIHTIRTFTSWQIRRTETKHLTDTPKPSLESVTDKKSKDDKLKRSSMTIEREENPQQIIQNLQIGCVTSASSRIQDLLWNVLDVGRLMRHGDSSAARYDLHSALPANIAHPTTSIAVSWKHKFSSQVVQGPAEMVIPGLCQECDGAPAVCQCDECSQRMCKACFDDIHKSGKRSGHPFKSLWRCDLFYMIPYLRLMLLCPFTFSRYWSIFYCSNQSVFFEGCSDCSLVFLCWYVRVKAQIKKHFSFKAF